MRKILVSVLSVAGLLAVVLALATSPAAAARSVVTINTPEIAGVYTVGWETQGSCDPEEDTSGPSGSVTITVKSTDTLGDEDNPEHLELEGEAGQEFVTVNDICTYEWSGSFVSAATSAQCAVGNLPENIPDAAVTLSLAVENCAAGGRITVTVAATPTATSSETCTAANIADDTEGPCSVTGADATTVKSTTNDYDDVSRGAISKTTFTVTATPVSSSKDSCEAASAETEYSKADGAVAKLDVVGEGAIVDGSQTNVNCEYDVEVALPDGFAAVGDTNQREAVSGEDTKVTLTVTVATRAIYLVQTVNGDADGAAANYRLWTNVCVADLPGALEARPGSGGIVGVTTVELREGRFNISAAVADSADDGASGSALDSKAVPCHTRAKISGLPDHCSAANPTNVETANLATDADDNGRVIIEMVITCEEPAAAEPTMPEPAEEPTMPEPVEPGDMEDPVDEDPGDMEDPVDEDPGDMEDPEPMGEPTEGEGSIGFTG